MAGVLTNFSNVYPGAISRSIDDIVISLPNADENAIAFGDPCFLNSDQNGAIAFASGAGMTTFLGVATRIGVKTPDAYPSNLAAYNPKEIMSIIVRGSVCVETVGSPKMGDKVYLTSAGKFTAVSTNNTELTNCKFRGPASNGKAEIVITDRNIQ